ncbi:MAG: cyclic nucleotide-binding domain-containing protein, partial [Thermodesulfobacteriota bacterium]
METPEVIEFLLTKVELFRGFSREQLERLLAESRLITFETNEVVIQFGQKGRYLGVLLEGQAEASLTDDRGEHHRLGTINPGDLFGEMSLMTGDKALSNVIGLTTCRALLVPQNAFTALIATHLPAITYLSRIMVDRLKSTKFENAAQDLANSALKRSDDPYGLSLHTDEPLKILAINCGSSSLKYNLYDTVNEAGGAEGLVERIGAEGTVLKHKSAQGELEKALPLGRHQEALEAMLEALISPQTGVLSNVAEVT